MHDRSFIWDNAKNWNRQHDRIVERLWVVGLLLASVLLFTINLGNLPLRDWDEGTVAHVAREIWQGGFNSPRWLYPTLGGDPYLNKPPLMHWLIALAYFLGGVNEWTSRLPGALLTAISVPLLYGIGREIFRQRSPAIFSALVYLTMLPLVRHGRLAMLDGAVVSFFLFTVWCLLRSRRNLRYCLGVGIGLGLICLTKGIVGLLLGALALLFLFWDTPRLLGSWYLLCGILLGSLPVVLWYAAQWWHYGHSFTDRAVVDQSLSRVWSTVENHQQPPWYYILEILKYTSPWLGFLPAGLTHAWKNRNWSWAKLVLVWTGGYLLAISVMGTKLPWYVLPIYPAIAIVVGVQLSQFWHQPNPAKYPRFVSAFLTLLAIATWVASVYFSPWGLGKDLELQLILIAVAGTMTLAAVLAARGDRQFISILIWGMYVSLLLFMTSPHWVWELAEAYPVKPVAALIQSKTPAGQKVYTSFAYNRPSLNFYSDRQVMPANLNDLQQYWLQFSQPYLLLDRATLKKLQLKSVRQQGSAEGWTLITKN
jgi:4-amino-4-deoxy-L-arabinose transferase-like glycosyltransferase